MYVQAIARCMDDLKPTWNNAEDPEVVLLDQEHDLLYYVSGNSSVHQRFIGIAGVPCSDFCRCFFTLNAVSSEASNLCMLVFGELDESLALQLNMPEPYSNLLSFFNQFWKKVHPL